MKRKRKRRRPPVSRPAATPLSRVTAATASKGSAFGIKMFAALAICVLVIVADIIWIRPSCWRELMSWFISTPKSENNEALVALCGVGAVIFTGALIAFQIREVSSHVQGALLLTSVAFVAPVLGIISSGPVLRVFALGSALYFFSKALTILLMRVVMMRFVASPQTEQRGLAIVRSDVEALILWGLGRIMVIQSFSLCVCAVSSVAVLIIPSATVLSWATLSTLVAAVGLITIALEQRRREPSTHQRARFEKGFAGIIGSIAEAAATLQRDDGDDVDPSTAQSIGIRWKLIVAVAALCFVITLISFALTAPDDHCRLCEMVATREHLLPAHVLRQVTGALFGVGGIGFAIAALFAASIIVFDFFRRRVPIWAVVPLSLVVATATGFAWGRLRFT